MSSLGPLQHDLPAGQQGDRVSFDREGCGVGRSLLPPEALRAVRAPVVEALTADGFVEPVEGQVDRLRWVAEQRRLKALEYQQRVEEGVDEHLLKSGLAGTAIEAVWGTPAAIWDGVRLFAAPPGNPPAAHRDAVMLSSGTEASGQIRLWIPLTELGPDDGSLAVAVGSHRIPDRPGSTPPGPHVLHPDLTSAHTRRIPLEEELAPLWRSSPLSVGDALVFRSDVVHSSGSNRGPFLRLSIVLTAQDARAPLGLRAGLSLDSGRPLADLEWVILAILAIQPTSAWHARCACYPRGIVGRTWAEQPHDRVERTLMTLQARKLVEPLPGDGEESWWTRRYSATPRGSHSVEHWLARPEARDPRLGSLKLLLARWLGAGATPTP